MPRRRLAIATGFAALGVAALGSAGTAQATADSPARGGAMIMFQYYGSAPAALHVAPPGGGTEKAVPKTRSGDTHPAYSPDGSKVAFTRNTSIWVMNANGKQQKRLTRGSGSFDWATWSPDGTKIAYASNETQADNTDIYVMNANGKHHVRLTTAGGTDYQPSWSSTGQIAFASYRVDEVPQVFVMNADGSGQTNLTNDSSYLDSDPDWSPDGSTLVFTNIGRSHPGSVGPDLWTMSADGSGVQPLAHQRDYSDGTAPEWSPDGSQIAFAANNGTGALRIWVCNADGTGQYEVAGDASGDSRDYPSWQPKS